MFVSNYFSEGSDAVMVVQFSYVYEIVEFLCGSDSQVFPCVGFSVCQFVSLVVPQEAVEDNVFGQHFVFACA